MGMKYPGWMERRKQSGQISAGRSSKGRRVWSECHPQEEEYYFHAGKLVAVGNRSASKSRAGSSDDRQIGGRIISCSSQGSRAFLNGQGSGGQAWKIVIKISCKH